jgi:hypothetical protein
VHVCDYYECSMYVEHVVGYEEVSGIYCTCMFVIHMFDMYVY